MKKASQGIFVGGISSGVLTAILGAIDGGADTAVIAGIAGAILGIIIGGIVGVLAYIHVFHYANRYAAIGAVKNFLREPSGLLQTHPGSTAPVFLFFVASLILHALILVLQPIIEQTARIFHDHTLSGPLHPETAGLLR